VEESINKGTIPLKNYTNSKTEPLTRSSTISGIDIGQISLEDEANEATNILLESGTQGSRGIVVMNGINVGSDNEGSPISMEYSFSVPVNHGTGSVILNGTDGSSTNAGEQVKFEAGTYEEFMSNLSPLTPVRWDSKNTLWDTTKITFDSID
jgi:hypothetical protein